jgi:hypothetical protein
VSKRTKFLLGIGVIAALVLGWQIAAFAVHNEGAFQLDGDATTNAVPPAPFPGDDWDRVCHEVTGSATKCSTSSDTSGANAVAWDEELDRSASIFTGGGSKDPNNIDQWAWKNGGGLPDKDNLLNAFAARYTVNNEQLLYFGSDRFDNSGDAVQGFWFFQQDVDKVGTTGGGFKGLHEDGDLLILSDFSNGGGTSTIGVYEWDAPGGSIAGGCTAAANNNPQPGQCGAANLRLLASATNANCASSTINNPPTNDRFCGIVNPSSGPLVGPGGITTSPWPFTDKSGNSGFANGEFFEGGVNLSAINLGDRCFASFASETRSSTSPTATLKDFIVGGFGNCTAGLTTTPVPAGPVSVGDTVHDSATLNITGVTNWAGTLKFFVCNPNELTGGVCATGTGTQVGADIPVTNATSQPISSDDVTVDQPGTWCFRGEFTSTTSGVPPSTDATTGECFTVRQTSSVATTQKWLPNDSATVTPAGTGGTVTFTLYDSNDCTGTVLYTEDDSSAPYATSNTTVEVNATNDVSWQAHFAPNADTNIDPSDGPCETSSLTIDNH